VEAVDVRYGHAEQDAYDAGWNHERERAGKVRGPRAGQHRIDQVVDDPGDARAEGLDALLGERARRQFAEAGVLGRVICTNLRVASCSGSTLTVERI
jgi:hypothetical protein